MSNQVFQQNLDDKKGPQPGGPYLIQMLFTAVMEKHIGAVECFCRDKKMAGFAALGHIAEFQDGKCPVQLMVMKCDKFKGKGFDAFLMSQMWDCQEDRDRIFRECRYQVVATDMLAAALPALERANLDADFLAALAELYPTCEAFYFQNCAFSPDRGAGPFHSLWGQCPFLQYPRHRGYAHRHSGHEHPVPAGPPVPLPRNGPQLGSEPRLQCGFLHSGA